MSFWTMLMIKTKDGNAEPVAQAHIKRRSTEEAVESIAGCLHAETMLSADEPDLFCVMCTWEDKAAYEQWLKSPLRAKQVEDLAAVFSRDCAESRTLSFQSVHTVVKKA